jgi:hypothetical protein
VPSGEAVVASGDAADFLVVLERLRSALGDARGKIRVADVRRVLDLEHASYFRSRLVARAMRHLGWERVRCRIDGAIVYAYARGTSLQREDVLVVVIEVDRRVVRRREGGIA